MGLDESNLEAAQVCIDGECLGQIRADFKVEFEKLAEKTGLHFIKEHVDCTGKLKCSKEFNKKCNKIYENKLKINKLYGIFCRTNKLRTKRKLFQRIEKIHLKNMNLIYA